MFPTHELQNVSRKKAEFQTSIPNLAGESTST